MTNKRFYYKKHIKGYVNTCEVGEYWCYDKGKLAPFLVTTKGYAEKVVELLNQLHQENQSLKEQLKEKQEEEQLYANEILELREANKEFIQFKELGGDY